MSAKDFMRRIGWILSGRVKDKSRWCLLEGDYCDFNCPHHYYRDTNGCCYPK